MNISVDQKFKDLERNDQKIAFDNLMEDQGISYKLVMDEACKDANDRSAAEKVIDNVINTISKRQKKAPTHSRVTPTPVDQTSTSSPKKTKAKKTLFTHKERLLRQTDSESDDDDDDDYAPSTTADAKTKGKSGIERLTLLQTYKKLGWPDTCNVICTNDPGRSSNPTRCLISIAKLMKLEVDEAKIKRIKHISDLEKFSLTRILEWFTKEGITLEENNQEYEELFRSDTKSKDMILIVSMNEINKKHESRLTDNPKQKEYAMLSIIIPTERHLMLTFNSTNTNLWFGSRIHNRKWGVIYGTQTNQSCKGYMSKNMYQKMDPIFNENGQLAGPNIRRKLEVVLKYTIKDSAKAYLPAAHKQS